MDPDKTWCLNFFLNSENDNTPRLWLRGELLKYKKSCKFLGVTFDQKLTFKEHVDDIIEGVIRIKDRTFTNYLDCHRVYTITVFIKVRQ